MKTKATRSPPLFSLPSLDASMKSVEIKGDEASHGLRVRRLRVGDAIELTNGCGLIASASITGIQSRPDCLNAAVSSVQQIPATMPRLVLACALPKGERQATMLDMATQLGMDQFIVLECDYNVVQFQQKMQDRWMRVITSACKQSRRAWTPAIGEPISPARLVETALPGSLVLYGDHAVSDHPDQPPDLYPYSQIIVMVGPEGGFSDREQRCLGQSEKAKAVAIGNHILRTETAAVALLSCANIRRVQFATPPT